MIWTVWLPVVCAATHLRRLIRRNRLANTPAEKREYLRKSQLWSQEFTGKVFSVVEFWLEKLPSGGDYAFEK
jgi:hypothetical protein